MAGKHRKFHHNAGVVGSKGDVGMNRQKVSPQSASERQFTKYSGTHPKNTQPQRLPMRGGIRL